MWIILSLIYALTNALYMSFNDTKNYNGYILGIWRGYGISLIIFPLLLSINLNLSPIYLIILILQGLLIGIYDSHIFFASARYGSNTGQGFMATSVLITTFLWWAIHISDLKLLLKTPELFITLILILCIASITYWQMMKVKANIKAEKYLYPAVFALAFMSIATHYIAIHGSTMYTAIIYYLTISCFISGIFNTIMYFHYKKQFPTIIKPNLKDGIKLILLSTILIATKTAAMRLCINPGFVVALLLLSPIFAELIKKHRLKLNLTKITFFLSLIALLIIISLIK